MSDNITPTSPESTGVPAPPSVDPYQAQYASPYPSPYPGQSPAPYQYAPKPERPGRTLGIVGFILSFFALIDIAGLIISIVGMSQSRRAGAKNGFALAGIIISIVGILFWAAIIAVTVPALVGAGQECAKLGNGTHTIGNSTYVCTPTSFNEYTTN